MKGFLRSSTVVHSEPAHSQERCSLQVQEHGQLGYVDIPEPYIGPEQRSTKALFQFFFQKVVLAVRSFCRTNFLSNFAVLQSKSKGSPSSANTHDAIFTQTEKQFYEDQSKSYLSSTYHVLGGILLQTKLSLYPFRVFSQFQFFGQQRKRSLIS